MRFAARLANQHESAATQVSCLGMHNRQRKANSYGSVNRVSARFHRLYPYSRGQFMHCRYHGVRRLHGDSEPDGSLGCTACGRKQEQQNEQLVMRWHGGWAV